jgi:hypothetical protein
VVPSHFFKNFPAQNGFRPDEGRLPADASTAAAGRSGSPGHPTRASTPGRCRSVWSRSAAVCGAADCPAPAAVR